MSGWIRWLRFNAVGALGIVVQLGILALLTNVLNAQYLVATAIAVEAAILHNFIWHERFTWVDRKSRGYMGRLLKFNATTGAFSIIGNILFTKLLSDAGLGHVGANAGAIILCSVINFLLSDRVVFVQST